MNAIRQHALAAPAPTGGGTGFALVAPEDIRAEAWQDLAEGSAFANPFLAPAFALAAIRHLGPRGFSIGTVTDGDRLAALMPLVVDRPWRRRCWTHPYAPAGVPLARPDALATLVAGLAASRPLAIPEVTGEEAFAALAGAAGAAGSALATVAETARAVALRSTWRGDLDLSRSRRKELRRLARRLADRGTVTWRTATAPRDVQAHFAAFVALEAAGWKGRQRTALASRTETLQFAREAVFAAAETGTVRIDSLNAGDRPAAMLVSFTAGNTLFAWKMAYREDVAALSPGVQLMLGLPERVFSETGFATIDSCADPDNGMINPLWPERLAVRRLLLGRPGAMFRSALTLERGEVSARFALRRLRSSRNRLVER